MENFSNFKRKTPWYCKTFCFYMIIIVISSIDFFTFYSVMDAIFQNTSQFQGLILSLAIVMMIDLPPMILSDLIPLKKKTIQILLWITTGAIILLMMTSIVQRLFSTDLVFEDIVLSDTSVSSNTKICQKLSMVLLSVLPIATSVFSFAISSKRKIVNAHNLYEQIKEEIVMEKAKQAELEATLAFNQVDFEEQRYSEAKAQLEKLGVSMKTIARHILAKHLGDKRAISLLCEPEGGVQGNNSATSASSAASANTPIAIPLIQQCF